MGNSLPEYHTDASVYTLDDKNRVALPTGFRHTYSVGGVGPFALTYGADSCLAVYPMEEWKRLQKYFHRKFLGLDRVQFARFQRWINSNTTFVQADQQGRIRLPQAMIDFARLDGEVRIVAMGNRLELWNPAEEKKFIGDAADFGEAMNRLTFDSVEREDELSLEDDESDFGGVPFPMRGD